MRARVAKDSYAYLEPSSGLTFLTSLLNRARRVRQSDETL